MPDNTGDGSDDPLLEFGKARRTAFLIVTNLLVGCSRSDRGDFFANITEDAVTLIEEGDPVLIALALAEIVTDIECRQASAEGANPLDVWGTYMLGSGE